MQNLQEFPDFIRALPQIELPFKGARGWLMQGQKMQTVFMEFDRETSIPEHTHAEQWEFPLAGKVRVKSERGDAEYMPGENFSIPADEPHSATVSGGYRALIIFNSPDRYRPKK